MNRTMASPYIEWAKLQSSARFNLATSGVMALPMAELGASLGELEISGPTFYGYAPLVERVAARFDVAPEMVVMAEGTSMANHLAMAALLEPGDEVIVEQPTYEPLLATAEYFGARVRRAVRRSQDGFRLDPDAVGRLVTPRTRLIVLANLHNPSMALADTASLEAIGALAERAGARVLVDEVYLDAVFDETPRSSVHLGPAFVATGSLTKVYGLSGLRCGWILADAALAHRIWRLNDLFGNIPSHPAELLSVVAFDQLPRLLARARALLEPNRELLNAFLAAHADALDTPPLRFGTTVCPAVRGRDVDRLCAVLRERYETSVVPGRFFEMPGHIRIGIGGDGHALAAGLDRLGRALEDPTAD
jgi:hypothetical protein